MTTATFLINNKLYLTHHDGYRENVEKVIKNCFESNATMDELRCQLDAKPITEKKITEFQWIDHAYFIDIENLTFYQLK